ncbi:hypothetical protein BK816_08755 [Boudabousia tangfeifanii]|uniref:Asp23/Gls24 family envelope stress response protein n=1 Tax=Boudabousia tangfeifanii TaxID=1912795 RepID=A0A1D9MM79_9ACTO|nr:Asp23/Gls24 family envelope stress response protein [Boudabousia tangfeifanii]AOZ73348.1 hypothetical protein BK816_08755 [Boudabousia tangfeifanii]
MANAKTPSPKTVAKNIETNPKETNMANENLPAKADVKKDVAERGTTTIADAVVAKVAGLALAEVKGVYAVGGGFSRALGAAREAFGASKNITQGVSVEVGSKQAAIDLSLIVEYPHPIHEVAEDVRKTVLGAVENIVGLEVVEVNIDVTDVHVPGEEPVEEEKPAEPKKEEKPEEPRVK